MSRRLQVIVDDKEYQYFKRLAQAAHTSLGEWVRQMLRQGSERTSSKSAQEKLRGLDQVIHNEFPTGDIDQVLREIERGYADGAE